MSDNQAKDNTVTVVTGHDIAAHPFFKERSQLDKVSGHEWMMVISLALTCAMGFRLSSIVLTLLSFPAWLSLFFFVILATLTGLSLKMKFKMPRSLSAVTFGAALGFLGGFVL